MPTKRSGSRAVRTKSQVSKFTSIREATGKRRSSAAGRVARTYFDPWSALRRLTHIRAGRTASQSPVCPDWTAAPLQRLSVLRDPPPHPGRSRLSYSEMRERLKDLVFCVQSSLKLLFSSRCCVSRRIGIKCCFFYYYSYCQGVSELARSEEISSASKFVESVPKSNQVERFLSVCCDKMIHRTICSDNNAKKEGKTWLIYTVMLKYAYTFIEMSTGGL